MEQTPRLEVVMLAPLSKAKTGYIDWDYQRQCSVISLSDLFLLIQTCIPLFYTVIVTSSTVTVIGDDYGWEYWNKNPVRSNYDKG